MVCTRSLAVSLKKNAVSQKAIDNSLLRYDNNSGEVKAFIHISNNDIAYSLKFYIGI